MATTAKNMAEFIHLSGLPGTYDETYEGGEECKADCVSVMQSEYGLNEAQAQAVADFVWRDGYERGWRAEWDRYTLFASELGELAQKVVEAA